MKSFIPHTLILAFWLGTIPSAYSQYATLVVNNNTNATLIVEAHYPYTQFWTAKIEVQPLTSRTLPGFLREGIARVWASAPLVRPRLQPIQVNYIVSGETRTRVWDISPSSLGKSFMADAPSPVDPPSTIVCRNLREGDPYYPEWSRCCDLGNNRSSWTSSYGSSGNYDGDCRYWGIH